MNDVVVMVPTRLGVDTRAAFREEAKLALERLEKAPADARLILDLSGTERVDSSGLGALLLVQSRAAERRRQVLLRGTSEEIRFLLLMTRLDDRFVLENGLNH
jgi:anti-anti-sigma factor